jgi:eukaryotic-like serine/threonine-protein kinase
MGNVAGTYLAWADRKGSVQPIPDQTPRLWGTGRLSPDGRRVANGIGAGSNDMDIWILEIDRGTLTRLTFGGRNDQPIWTPNGRTVVYGGTTGDQSGLYSVPADGTARPTLLRRTPKRPIPLSMTPDGRTVAYRQDSNGSPKIFLLDIDTGGNVGEPHQLRDSAGNELDADISPNGKWIAFASTETGDPEVYVMPLSGSGARTRVSINGGHDPRWSQDGRELFYWSSVAVRSVLNSVSVQLSPSFSVGRPIELFREFTGGTTWGPSPDGKRFLVETTWSPATGQADVETSFAVVTNWFEDLRRRAPPRTR